ncbi:propionyl-CoA synthetase [Rhodococcus sp. WB9]|uniref:AMP-binding protein n=1 Tax=Rhodococcus sp. WB9 TaxID=2594007 RepID=UPI0011868773|nr:AMP-binding protein [Rhodococcus sp. WB9]QDQ95391.1 propionyl-CoA synthetase [Rhodococcus sp. WB9]
MTSYSSLYESWRADPLGFWGKQAASIDWDTPWTAVFDGDTGPYGRWFPGGRLNTSYNCLDRHVEAGAGDRLALVWDSAMTGESASYTYREMRDHVAKVAGALAAVGVVRGDRVVIYMPMVPDAAIAMLACARLGAVHSVVFGGFAASELAARIDATEPRVIIAASCGVEPGRVVAYKPVLDAALLQARHRPEACFVLQRPQSIAELHPGRDHDLLAAAAAARPHPPVPVVATDPLYILHTSGTTGRPKGVVRDNGGHAVALAASIPTIFGLQAGDVLWAASDVGWVVGHSYIVYAPLLAGLTTVMYEGKPIGTPDAGAFWNVIARHQVNVLFTAPTAIRAIRRQDPELELMNRYDISSLRAVFLAGERCDPPTATWLQTRIDRPVIDNWWQTETGWPITARFRGGELTPFKPGSGGRPSPGFEIRALDDDGVPLPAGETGNLALRLPLPPGCAPTLWGDDDGYRTSYLDDFPGWYRTGDAGYLDADGDVWVLGRTDDIINVAGHRLSTGAMEEVLAAHPDVAECAVIGVSDPLKGESPVGLVVLKTAVSRDPETVVSELVDMVRSQIGAVAAFRTAVVVDQLPKTRSGKILRRTLRNLANGEPVQVPPTIEDASVLDRLRDTFPASRPASVH